MKPSRAPHGCARDRRHRIVHCINNLSTIAVAALYIRIRVTVAVIDQPFVFAPFVRLECVLLLFYRCNLATIQPTLERVRASRQHRCNPAKGGGCCATG
jgi:hypothetical protein